MTEFSDIQQKERWGRVGWEEGRGLSVELVSDVVSLRSPPASRVNIGWSVKETHGFSKWAFHHSHWTSVSFRKGFLGSLWVFRI